MDPTTLDPRALFAAFAAHRWSTVVLLVAMPLLGFVVRLLKDDTVLPTVSSAWRAPLSLVLNVALAACVSVFGGLPWAASLTAAIFSAFGAQAGHNVIINGIRDGRELPLPRWLLTKTAQAQNAKTKHDLERVSLPPPPPAAPSS